MEYIVGALAVGLVFWLAGGASWVEEKTRALKLQNDAKEVKLKDQIKAEKE